MGKAGCAVFGCIPSKASSRHGFPNPHKNIQRFMKWLSACVNRSLGELSPQYIYEHYRICSKHFDERSFGSNRRLRADAYPSLFLPGPEEIDTSVIGDHSYSKRNALDLPSTSSEIESGGNNSTVSTTYLEDSIKEPVTSELILGANASTIPSSTYLPERTVQVRRVSTIQPGELLLYKKMKGYQQSKNSLKRKNIILKCRLRKALKYSQSHAFEKMTVDMNTAQKNFFKSQVKCSAKTKKGRRFDDQDKITALAIYKQSGTAYRFLSQLFALPSRQTLMKLLNKVAIEPGMNSTVFTGLAEMAKTMKPLDRHCFILFDEMSISPNLSYNPNKDEIEGFENFGDYMTGNVADHVQVYMLRGVHRKWKQPLLYHYVQGAAKAAQIMNTLRKIITALTEAGFSVLGTICDQGANNLSAINHLVEDTKKEYKKRGEELYDYVFEVNGKRIVPLFDFPHLIKGVRNNLLTKNIIFTTNKKKIAKWSHINTAWQLDNSSGELRSMPKITEWHVNKDKIKKMKVSICTQIFSHTVASTINLMAKSGYRVGNITMDAEATETADFLKFFNDLFDSINGSSDVDTKLLKTRVNVVGEVSPHIDFWKAAIKTIDTMRCVDSSGKQTVPPTFKNWQLSLRNMALLTTILKDVGFQSFCPRYLNQDPLENFFGKVRQRGSRYTNPTCSAFGPFYKSLLVNNLVTKHSPGSNCEDDNSNILLTLQKFLKQTDSTNIPEASNVGGFNFQLPENFHAMKDLELSVLAYVAGYLAKITSSLKKCAVCKYNILKRPEDKEYYEEFVKLKDYGGAIHNKLHYCNQPLVATMIKIYNIVMCILKQNCAIKNVLKKILIIVEKEVDFNFKFCCHSIEVQKTITNRFCKLIIFNYVKGANNLIRKRDLRPLPDTCSLLYQQCRKISSKYK